MLLYLLSLEGRQLGQFEVIRKQFSEFLWFMDNEATSMWLPGYNVLVTVLNHSAKHIVKFQRERHSDTATCRLILLVINTAVMSMIMVAMLDNDVVVLAANCRIRGGRRGFQR